MIPTLQLGQLGLARRATGGGGGAALAFDPTRIDPNVTLSNANRTASTASNGGMFGAKMLYPKTSGKWMFEVTVNAKPGGGHIAVGVMELNEAIVSSSPAVTNGINYYSNGTTVNYLYDGSVQQVLAAGNNINTGNVITVAIDFDAATVSVYRDGALMGSDAAISTLSFSGGKSYVPFVDLWGVDAPNPCTATVNTTILYPVGGYTQWAP